MRYALLSDIHANWEALEKAAEYLETAGIEKIAVLGDTVGYGADPVRCLEWAFEHADILLSGNHEKALTDHKLRFWFNPVAREALEWTEKNMAPELIRKVQNVSCLKKEEDLVFAHSSPDAPDEFRYLMSYEDTEPSFRAFKEPVCFVGHTHVPACFSLERKSGYYLEPGKIRLEGRVILNPGSVGQPRDKDPRLSFGIYDRDENIFEIVRLEYDNQKAAAKIRKAGLPDFLAARLL